MEQMGGTNEKYSRVYRCRPGSENKSVKINSVTSNLFSISALMNLQRLFGTRSRIESAMAWSIALGGAYFLYLRDKESATKDALAQGAEFSSDDTARWNAQIKADNPKEFTQAAAKAASLSKASAVSNSKSAPLADAAVAAGSKVDGAAAAADRS